MLTLLYLHMFGGTVSVAWCIVYSPAFKLPTETASNAVLLRFCAKAFLLWCIWPVWLLLALLMLLGINLGKIL